MNLPEDRKYTRTHEWAQLSSDGIVVVGITDHAQDQLGDIVFLELPQPGRKIAADEQVAVVESVKTASDIHAPVAGEIIESNQSAIDTPESVNSGAYATWLFKIKPANGTDIAALLDADGYRKIIADA